MEFNEKLQELRKQKGITQEELANVLFVSRTAISKWESGRGYPNIDSLKAIAKFFSVTIDELLSCDQVLNIAEEDNRQKEKHFCDLVFGLLDVSIIVFLFLPFFGQKSKGLVQGVSLLLLNETQAYLKILYFVFTIGIIITGITTLALQNCNWRFWDNNKHKISLILNGGGLLLFIVSLQPYAAVFLLIFFVMKVLLLVKKR